MISGDEVCNAIITGSNSDQNWLKLEDADMIEEFSETVLDLRVTWFLIGDSFNNSFIVTVNGNPPASPEVSPQSGGEDHTPELCSKVSFSRMFYSVNIKGRSDPETMKSINYNNITKTRNTERPLPHG